MSRYQKDLGDFGEKVAENYYLQRGFRVLEKNFNVPRGELDLIVESEELLVFVEVKTRSNMRFGTPAEAITAKKILHIKRAAEAYLLKFPSEKEMRFDAIEVFAKIDNGVPVLEHINHIPDIIF